ncbi:MAG: phosphoribosyltransferase [Gemmatimonadaceae bacterium]|nr:phosphoribosyltransferase [Gemmatimonadaceae bacterium]
MLIQIHSFPTRLMRQREDFVNQAGVSNPHMPGGIHLNRWIEFAYDYSASIWATPMHTQFVDHGLSHSYSVLRRALLILGKVLSGHPREQQLSDLERATLAVAALIHDTGMQWDHYEPTSTRLGLEESRRRHAPNCISLIRRALASAPGDGIPTLRHALPYNSLFGTAAKIGAAHSGDETWNAVVSLAEDDVGLQDFPLRAKLLAAALRLADEIDNDYSRINDYSRLTSDALDDLTLSHWAACYYIHDVRIDATAGVGILLFPRFPDAAKEDEIDGIRFLIDHYRVRRMREEAERVKPFLRVGQNRPALVDVRIADHRLHAIEHFPVRLRTYISSMRRQQAATPQGPATRASTIAGSNSFLSRAANKISECEASGRLLDSAAHTALRTGWHCNRYYRFGNLLGDGQFLSDLGRGAAEHYRNVGIERVIGVGTCGAQMASIIGLSLRVPFTYTFASSSAAAEPGTQSATTDYEMDLGDATPARVLVVDDLVGTGSAAAETVLRLRARGGPAPVVHIFALLLAGDAEALFRDVDDISVDVLSTARDISYWEEGSDGHCDVCRSAEVFVERET